MGLLPSAGVWQVSAFTWQPFRSAILVFRANAALGIPCGQFQQSDRGLQQRQESPKAFCLLISCYMLFNNHVGPMLCVGL